MVTWAVPRIVAKNLLLIGCIHAPSKSYEGQRAALTTPIKHSATGRLTDHQRTVSLLHAATRAPAERGNSLLQTTFKALRRVSLCPWRIGAITAAALVLPHHQHGRTT